MAPAASTKRKYSKNSLLGRNSKRTNFSLPFLAVATQTLPSFPMRPFSCSFSALFLLLTCGIGFAQPRHVEATSDDATLQLNSLRNAIHEDIQPRLREAINQTSNPNNIQVFES